VAKGHRDPSWKRKGYYNEEFSCPSCGGVVTKVYPEVEATIHDGTVHFYCSTCNVYVRSEDVHWKKVPVD